MIIRYLLVLLFLNSVQLIGNTINSEKSKLKATDSLHISLLIDKAVQVSKSNTHLFAQYLDTATRLIENSASLYYKTRLYNLKGGYLLENYQLDSARYYLVKAQQFAKKNKDTEFIQKINGNLGLYYLRVDSLDISMQYLIKGYQYYLKEKNEKMIAKSALDLSFLFKNLTNYDSSLFYGQVAEKHFLKLKDTLGIIISGNSISILMAEMGLYKQSILKYKYIWHLDTLYDGVYFLPSLYLNMGDLYSRRLNMNDSGEYFLSLSLKEGEKSNNQYLIEASKVNLSNVYYNQKDYKKMVEILRGTTNSIYNNIKVSSLINFGIALKELKADSSYYYLTKGVELANELEMLHFLQIGYKHLYQLDSINGNFKSAFINYQLLTAINDSINSKSNRESITNLENKYKIEKEIQEKTFWQTQSKIKSELLKRKSIINQLLFWLMSALVGYIILIFINRRKKQKHNAELLYFNKELHQRNDELAKVNDMKNSLFSILSHDLKSHIGPTNQLLQILADDYEQYDDEERKNLLKSIAKNSENTRSLLDNILEWIRIQHNKTYYSIETINLKTEIQQAIDILNIDNKKQEISIKNEVEEEIEIETDPNIIKTVTRNLISNALKFTPAGGEITIKSKNEDQWVVLSICDNGIGMTQEVLNKIFDYKMRHASVGLNDEKGSGLGLKLVKQLIEMIGGNIEAESQIGKGSTFNIRMSKNPRNKD